MAHIQLHGQCSYSYAIVTQSTSDNKLKLYRTSIAGASDADETIRRIYFYTLIDTSYNNKTYEIHLGNYSGTASINICNLKNTTPISNTTTIDWPEGYSYYSSMPNLTSTETITLVNGSTNYTFHDITNQSVLFIRRPDALLSDMTSDDFDGEYNTSQHYAQFTDNINYYLAGEEPGPGPTPGSDVVEFFESTDGIHGYQIERLTSLDFFAPPASELTNNDDRNCYQNFLNNRRVPLFNSSSHTIDAPFTVWATDAPQWYRASNSNNVGGVRGVLWHYTGSSAVYASRWAHLTTNTYWYPEGDSHIYTPESTKYSNRSKLHGFSNNSNYYVNLQSGTSNWYVYTIPSNAKAIRIIPKHYGVHGNCSIYAIQNRPGQTDATTQIDDATFTQNLIAQAYVLAGQNIAHNIIFAGGFGGYSGRIIIEDLLKLSEFDPTEYFTIQYITSNTAAGVQRFSLSTDEELQLLDGGTEPNGSLYKIYRQDDFLLSSATGSPNDSAQQTIVHAYIGLDHRGRNNAITVEILPESLRCAGSGWYDSSSDPESDSNFSCNNGWIQFEMSERGNFVPGEDTSDDSVKWTYASIVQANGIDINTLTAAQKVRYQDTYEYRRNVYQEACKFSAYICLKYGLKPTDFVTERHGNVSRQIPVVTSHSEGSYRKVASIRPSEPVDWFFKRNGKTWNDAWNNDNNEIFDAMDMIRADVEYLLNKFYIRSTVPTPHTVTWVNSGNVTMTSTYNTYTYTPRSGPTPSDLPEPLDPPSITMPAPSTDAPAAISQSSSKWYHAENLNGSSSYANTNTSFIDFWFNGKRAHDFKLYRVSDGNRYNANLTSSINDTTIGIPGRDGQLWFYAKYQPRKFTINYAFDNLTDSDVRAIRRWLNKDAYGDLIFTETPSRAYSVKVTSQPTFNFVPFNTYDRFGEQNLYRGEGKVEFTAYYPFAHTPNPYNNYVGIQNGVLNGWEGYSWESNNETVIADKLAQHYAFYSQGLPKDESDYWYQPEDDNLNIRFVRNYGDLGMPFTIGLAPSASMLNLTIYRHTSNGYDENPINQLVIAPHTENLIWDSATGLIYAVDNNKQIVHNEKCLKGNTVMAIDPFEDPATDYYAFVYAGGELDEGNLVNYFWYY